MDSRVVVKSSVCNRSGIRMEINFCTLRDVYWFYLELTPRVMGGLSLLTTKYREKENL